MKRIIRIGLAVIFSSIVIAWLCLVRIPDRMITVQIPNGASALQVTALLSNEGLIVSRTFFMVWLRAVGGIKRIKAGHYRFSSRSLTPSIIHKLIQGRSVLTRLTIPEGLTIKQAAQILARQKFGDEQVFIDIFQERGLEGYVFPETYVIAQGLNEHQLTGIFQKQFEKTFSDEWDARVRTLNMTRHQIIILASIIEKEAKVDHERPLVSAVFHNRLRSNKLLESCATIQFALGRWKKRLSLKDLKVDSSYNTYQHYGLPPGPICSPGRKSIEAALYPAETDALFFISNGDGTHSFHSRYRDHLKEKKEYKNMIKEYRKRKKSAPFE